MPFTWTEWEWNGLVRSVLVTADDGSTHYRADLHLMDVGVACVTTGATRQEAINRLYVSVPQMIEDLAGRLAADDPADDRPTLKRKLGQLTWFQKHQHGQLLGRNALDRAWP